MAATLQQCLKLMISKGASDLHITVNSPPVLRVHGKILPVNAPTLTPMDTKDMCYSILTEQQKARFEAEKELDFAFEIKDLCRFRANLFMQRGACAGAFRSLSYRPRPLDELGLPAALGLLAKKAKGLILVTGPTGSGKSTSLAAMIDRINDNLQGHIITVEDPIEYVHDHKKSIVNQRELNVDTDSFPKALRAMLRQDPDVVLIGEMRDLETVQTALTIAETGHLTFATLHTNSCVETINRIIDVFPAYQQPQIRTQLSFVLEGVVTQSLIPNKSGNGRVPACEIMIPNPAIRNLIREDKIHQIYSQMQLGQSKYGMQTMNQALYELLRLQKISVEEGLAHSHDQEELRNMLAGAVTPQQTQPAKAAQSQSKPAGA